MIALKLQQCTALRTTAQKTSDAQIRCLEKSMVAESVIRV